MEQNGDVNLWISKEKAKERYKRMKYEPLVEAAIVVEGQEVPITSYRKYKDFWSLINVIIIEKWSREDGAFRGGDISEKLLNRICKVLRKRIEDDIKKRYNPETSLEWDLEEERYKKFTEGCEAIGKY